VRHDTVRCFILVHKVCVYDLCDRNCSALECKMLLAIANHALFTANIVTGS
jgi:hypothetical protein